MLQKNKSTPFKIKSFISKLATQHHAHDIDNTTQTYKTITKTSPIKDKNIEKSIYKKGRFFQSQQYITSPIPKMNSQHKIQSQNKSQKSFEFKIQKIQCGQDINEGKRKNLLEDSLNSVDILGKLLNNRVSHNQKLRENDNELMESQLKQFNNKIQNQKNSKFKKQESIKNPQSITYLNNNKNIQVQKQSNNLNNSQLKKEYNINQTEKMKKSNIILEKDLKFDLKQNGTTQKKIQKNNKTLQRQFKRIQKQSQISTRQINTPAHFVTQKKKPFQSQNNSPTISQYLVGRTQQHLKQTQSQIKPSKTPDKSASNLLFQLLGNMQTPPEKNQSNINQRKKLCLNQQKGCNMLLKAFAHIDLKNSENHMEKLKTAMKNQKNLKLKDYLRLASLSSDSKFDNWSKNSTPNKNNLTTNRTPFIQDDIMLSQIQKSFIFNKAKTPIDSQKSINLIKSSVKKKLQKIMNASMKVLMQLQQNKQLIGNEYQDLVFMCNFHKIFDENMFKAADLLQDLLNQYEEKRRFIHMLKTQEMTQETVKQMMSPKRRKKQSNFNLSLIQKILKGLNIIKNEVLQ